MAALVDLQLLGQVLPPECYSTVLAHSTPASASPAATTILLNTASGLGVCVVAAATVALAPKPLTALTVGSLAYAGRSPCVSVPIHSMMCKGRHI